MQKALILVIILGAGIGFMLPARNAPAPEAAVADVGRSGPTRLERRDNGHFYVHAAVNGELVHFLIDTGASGVALTMRDAERLGVEFSPGEFGMIGRGASGEVRGQLVTLDSVDIEGKKVTDVRGAVVEGLDISLLGQSYLSRISGVEMSGDYMILR